MRGSQVSSIELSKNGIKRSESIPFNIEGTGDSAWLAALSSCLEPLDLNGNLATIVAIPNRLLLFKAFIVPTGSVSKQRELLQYEIEQNFPHGDSELIWSSILLQHDDVESAHLVAAIRKSTFLSMLESFESAGCRQVIGVPSLFMAFPEVTRSSFQNNEDGLEHILAIEHNHGVSVSFGNNRGSVRAFKLKGIPSSVELDPHSMQWETSLKTELKKTMAAAKRQLRAGKGARLSLFVSGEDESVSPDLLTDSYGVDGPDSIKDICNSIEGFHQNIASFDSQAFLKLESAETTSGHSEKWKWLLAAGLIAIAPYLWVMGNHRVTDAYRKTAHEARTMSGKQRELAVSFDTSVKDLTSNLERIENQVRLELQQAAVLPLFQALQQALEEVGDTWFETMNLTLESDTGTGDRSLTLSGKFLVRQSNLRDEYRQQAISEAEYSLQELQDQMLASPFFREIRDFTVNYSGIDHGINVVPFKLEVVLDSPFSEKEREEEDEIEL